MEAFALEVLDEAKSWNWRTVPRLQKSGKESSNFKALAPEFISWLIRESVKLGGTVLDQFWETVGKCDNRLKDNSASHFSTSERQGPILLYS